MTCLETINTSEAAGLTAKQQNEWERFRQQWIAKPTGNEDVTSLDQARAWLKSTMRNADKKQLSFIIKDVLGDVKKEGENDGEESSQAALRMIEWQVVSLLELWILNGDSFLERFSKILKRQQRKQLSKRKKKKKLSSLNVSPEQALLDQIVQVLSRSAFLLPGDEPVGAFLTKKCLTERIWKQKPNALSYVMEYFEISNPYLAKKEEETASKPMVKKQKKKAQPAPQTKPPLRRLPLKRDNFRGSHFHGKLQDMSRLLDQTPKSTAFGKKPRPLITPHSTKTVVTKKNEKLNNKRPRCVEETPRPPKRVHHETPPRRSVVAETPAAKFVLPHHGVVAETPAAKIVGETPAMKGERLFLSPQAPQQPVKLFGALKPRVTKVLLPSPKKKSKGSIRSAPVALAAARAYLRRKSL